MKLGEESATYREEWKDVNDTVNGPRKVWPMGNKSGFSSKRMQMPIHQLLTSDNPPHCSSKSPILYIYYRQVIYLLCKGRKGKVKKRESGGLTVSRKVSNVKKFNNWNSINIPVIARDFCINAIDIFPKAHVSKAPHNWPFKSPESSANLP